MSTGIKRVFISRILTLGGKLRVTVGNKAHIDVNVCSRQLRHSSNTVYAHGKHRSDAEKLINSVPVIEVKGNVAVCDGGNGALGHPLEYIQLKNVHDVPAICKYCGLRYKKAAGNHHH